MPAIGSSRNRLAAGIAWIVFAAGNSVLMFALPDQETIYYHLIWASFALLYGIFRWSITVTWSAFTAITIVTGIPIIEHARAGITGWSECWEIVLMGVILALLIWHVNRQRAARDTLITLQDQERRNAQQRQTAARAGSHEIRTRLTIARGYAELIAESTPDPQARADMGIVVNELIAATELVIGILDPRTPADPHHPSTATSPEPPMQTDHAGHPRPTRPHRH